MLVALVKLHGANLQPQVEHAQMVVATVSQQSSSGHVHSQVVDAYALQHNISLLLRHQ